MSEHPAERAAIERDDRLECGLGLPIEHALLRCRAPPQEPRAHHRRQRQRHERRHEDRDAQGDCEFAEQSADDVAHEEEGNEHRDERHGQGENRESDLLRPAQRRLERGHTCLDIARNVLDHHDRVIDDEAGRDRQRHQRQVVEAVAEEIHGAECPDE